MIKAVLTLVLFMIIQTSFSQNLSIDDLILKSTCKTFDCFNDFVTSKDFSFELTTEDSGYTTYEFTSNVQVIASSNKDVTTKNLAFLYLYKNGNIETSFLTTVVSTYNNIVKEIKAKGFKSTGGKNENGMVMTLYKSPLNPNVFLKVTIGSTMGNVGKTTKYIVSIIRFPNS